MGCIYLLTTLQTMDACIYLCHGEQVDQRKKWAIKALQHTFDLLYSTLALTPEVIKEKCDCMAAHPTWEGYN